MKSTTTLSAASTPATGFSPGDWARAIAFVVVAAIALYVATEPKQAYRLMAWPQQIAAGLFGDSKSDIESRVRSMTQGEFDTGSMSGRGLTVGSVMLVESGRNTFGGVVKVLSSDGRACGSLTIDVVVDRERTLVRPTNQQGMLGCVLG